MTRPAVGNRGGGSAGPRTLGIDGPVIPPTPEQSRAAALFAADAALRGGWTHALPDVLAALGITPNPTGRN